MSLLYTPPSLIYWLFLSYLATCSVVERPDITPICRAGRRGMRQSRCLTSFPFDKEIKRLPWGLSAHRQYSVTRLPQLQENLRKWACNIFSLFSRKPAKEKEVGNDCWVNQLIVFITELKNLRDMEDKIMTVSHVNWEFQKKSGEKWKRQYLKKWWLQFFQNDKRPEILNKSQTG